ncbi:MAG: DNA repair protein RadA [Gammaproteobacteria bacterium CG11_big_fil_rev_8_21_14_0_20_46_22]|nr:MAG: DNA repair protein RadA [Gammaproteobacteria bacterium CG12_big_fil_rev_8_21_14_0_65_46_12]PIR10335.1 MAG: DNA repair protein RadA [Gammaproteobacteria bacterium CG11_big_fil_rev_8_21_14_0_20_46_22]
MKTIFACQKCGSQFPKWSGPCGECGAWNSLVEEAPATSAKVADKLKGYAGEKAADITSLKDVSLESEARIQTPMQEFNRVLGGGIVQGSVVLIGGSPGVGKSTLLLQVLTDLSQAKHSVLYVTGEESLSQVASRAKRLQLKADELSLLADTQVENIMTKAKKLKPQVMVVDSIQTIFTEHLSAAPGSVSQVRESAAQLVRFAKTTNITLFIVGHVTKEGTIAGPRVLEHMVDTVLYFEGEGSSRYRVIRAIKNRFGAVNELGIFAMLEGGLKPVSNPSAIFLSKDMPEQSGSVLMAAWEGSRPLLLEVQALLDDNESGYTKRVTVGLDQNRLAMLLAVLNKHTGISCHQQDVFVNIVGGMRVSETAADLAILLAAVSSLKNRPLSREVIVFGEVGLGGEIRPVPNGEARLKEAAKHGFKRAIVPKANAPKKPLPDIEVKAVERLSDALSELF